MTVIESSDVEAHALMKVYQQLSTLSQRMIDLARDKNWQGVLDERQHYEGVVTTIASLEERVILSEPQQQKKRALLEHILECDMEVRCRLVERRDELSDLMASSRNERDVTRYYGAAGDHA